MEQRTGPGRFKKVVSYRRGLVYGNDLCGQRIAPCDNGSDMEKGVHQFRLSVDTYSRVGQCSIPRGGYGHPWIGKGGCWKQVLAILKTGGCLG